MKWLTTSDPETGYLVTEIAEERLDGVSKISTPFLGMYRVVEPDTVHVIIPLDNRTANRHENHHDVFQNVPDAKEFIQNHVLSHP